MTQALLTSPHDFISEIITKLRSYCQVNIQSDWLYQERDWLFTDINLNDFSNWQPVQVNPQGYITWTGEKRCCGWYKN